MRKIAVISASLLALIGCTSGNGALTIYQTEALSQILSTDIVSEDAPDTIHVARGENAVFQFVVSARDSLSSLDADVSIKDLGEVQTGWVHDVLNHNPPRGAEDMLLTPDDRYPDPIFDDMPETVGAEGQRTLVTDIAIPHTAKSGIHKGKVTVSGIAADGRKVAASKRFTIKVYPVDLPEKQNLKVVNWCSKASSLSVMNGGKEVEPRSDEYIDLMRIIVRSGAANGQNCWMMTDKPTPVLNADSTDFVLDFTFFDKFIEMLEEEGNMQYFCNSHFGRKVAITTDEEMVFDIIYVEDKQIKRETVPSRDPRVEPFIKNYFSQIEVHFREKGWLDKCYQHIADEPSRPGTEGQQSWSRVAAMVKKYAPGLRTIDASTEIIENQDVSVVCLSDNVETNPPVPEGSERWMYTCCVPKLNFANRFVQLPLLKTRILHWINYRYNECGYLHWGYNQWHHSTDPLHDVTLQGRPNLPGGDAYIVYPGDRKVYPSIRLWAMRDGIRDYDLLKMVEARDPEKAMQWCRSIVLSSDKYNMDTKHFRQVRREILEYLSE